MAIFKKSDDNDRPDMAPEPKPGRTRSLRSKKVAVIGSTLVIKGELSADEDLIIDGHIEGTITHHKKNLTVGETGRVKADSSPLITSVDPMTATFLDRGGRDLPGFGSGAMSGPSLLSDFLNIAISSSARGFEMTLPACF